MKIPLLSLFLFFFSQVFAQNPNGIKSISSFQEYAQLLEAAQRGDKMIFVALFDKSENSKKVKAQNAFSSPSFVNNFDGYTAIEFSTNSEIGKQWLEAFPVDELPSFFVLNKNEIILESISGYQNTASLEKLLQDYKLDKNLYQTLNTKYGKGELSPTEWTNLIHIHSLNFDFNQTQKIAREFLNSLDEVTLLDKKVIPVLVQYGIDLESKYPSFILKNKKQIASKWPEFNESEWFQTTYSYNLDRALFNRDSTLLSKIKNPLIAESNEEDKATLSYTTYEVYVEETQQYSLLKDAVLDYTSSIKDSAVKARAIFDMAFDIADKNDSKQALAVSKSLANEASKYGSDFRFKMLESYSAYQLGNLEDAEQLALDAKSIAKMQKSKNKADNLLRVIRRKKESAVSSD